ncbi:MAG TPA: cytochrome b/b6 domain-containing protein [Acidimicrobiales bacterium]|nr:cytochrome b/b6 domain-containing protein [Acidimicrobiales bacterium]
MTLPSAEPANSADLERFDLVERGLHWVNAGLFGVVMLTAVPLYIGSLAGIFGRRHLLVEIHVWAGVALPVPLLLALAGPWGRNLRDDLSRFNRWTKDDFDWLFSSARRLQARVGKFNAGQKLNAAFIGGSIVVMLATGSIMKWFSPFPNSWRTGATFVHDLLATAIFVVVAGHIAFALTHVDALRSSITGRVSRTWARRYAPAWLEEMERAEVLGTQRGVSTPRGSLAGSQSRSASADLKANRSVIPPT